MLIKLNQCAYIFKGITKGAPVCIFTFFLCFYNFYLLYLKKKNNMDICNYCLFQLLLKCPEYLLKPFLQSMVKPRDNANTAPSSRGSISALQAHRTVSSRGNAPSRGWR